MANPFYKSKVCREWGRLTRYLVVGLAIACLVLLVNQPLWAQAAPPTPNVPGMPTNPFIRSFQFAPPELKDIFANGEDAIDLAPIYLDGRPLFNVAAVGEEGGLSATERANTIEQQLEKIARTVTDLPSLEDLSVTIEVDEESNQPVIYVNGESLMTITYLDAVLSGSNSLSVEAERIASEVDYALERYYQERQPNFLWRQVRWSVVTLVVTLLLSLLLRYVYRRLERRYNSLKEMKQQQTAVERSPEVDGTSVDVIRTKLTLQQRINQLGITRQVLRLAQLVLWFGSGLLVLGFFPYTRWLQPIVINFVRLPIRLLVIGMITYGLIRLSGVWVDRLFLAFQSETAATLERSQRLILRLSTFSQVIKGVVAFVIGGVAFLFMLSLLGVRVAPLLAGAGLLGFAVTFASQNLIKDFINGFLILLEDQYGVGDVINVKGVGGFVETMNLRITQLRSTEGQLITIPNGQIDIVQNLSKEWSRVDIIVPVSLEADINQALQLVEEVANEMFQDKIWNTLILEPPLLLGVDNLDYVGASIRLWIKTLPLKQWDVAREYRRRLKIAFEKAQIPIGVPQQVVHFSDTPAPTPPTELGVADGAAAEGPARRPPSHP